MTVAQSTVETLLVHGIDTIYCLPGFHNDPLFDTFYTYQHKLKIIHTRHEQAACYMALGAALATGKPQICSVVPGPGFLNTASAFLTAYGMNQPVVGLIGQIPDRDIDVGHGHLHELHDQIGIAQHISKFTGRIVSPQGAADMLSGAFQAVSSDRNRPAIIECGLDMWAREAAVRMPITPLPLTRPAIDPDLVKRAAKILGAANRPLIVVGGGATEASTEIVALAELLEAPVGAYRRGRGVMSSLHRLSVNLPVEHRLWAEADVVLAIGTRLHMQQSMWGVDEHLKIIRIDIDPEEPSRFLEPAIALVGDAVDACRALQNILPSQMIHRLERTEELKRHHAWLNQRLQSLQPQVDILKAIREALPEEGIFVEDVTQLGFAGRLAFPCYKPRTYISPGYQDNLGWAFGTGLGIKSARPDTPVLAVAGDGGFMYQVGELATARRHNINLVVLVFDNGLYGNVRRIQQDHFGGRYIASDLVNPDFVKLADSFGVASFRAATPSQLKNSIVEAFALNQPALIHYPIPEVPSPWDMILMKKVRG